MTRSMSRKFEKYWKKSSTALVIAGFLDPRYKRRLIEFYMRKFHGISSQVYVDELLDIIKKLYQSYAAAAPSTVMPTSGSNDAKHVYIADQLVESGSDDVNNEIEKYLYQSSRHDSNDMNELEKYMVDAPLRLSGQFDILAFLYLR
jgi:hypothetical protein